MNVDELRAAIQAAVDEMREIDARFEAGGDDHDADADQTRFDVLEASADQHRKELEAIEKRRSAIEKAAAVPGATVRAVPQVSRDLGDPYDVSTLRFDTPAADLKARALTAIERDELMPDEVKERATQAFRRIKGTAALARLMLATGSDAYRQGFGNAVMGRQWAIDDTQRAALMRAQSTTDASGGFAVPFTLDPTVLFTDDSSANPIRQIARVEAIMTDSWNGVSSAGATASWAAEAAEATDDAITLAQPSVPVHKMHVFTPFSVEIEGDWASIEDDLRTAMLEARDDLEATAHISGTGSNQPTGIVTALDGTASEISPDTAEVFAAADVYKLKSALGARYKRNRDQAQWLAHYGTYNDIRQFDTGGGGNFWVDLNGDTPERMLGWRTHEASAMANSEDINPAVTADNFVLIVGDWKRYLIADRVGFRVELIPHLFATANNRPSGQRGFYGWLRTGADSLDDNAFRALNVATTL